MIPARDLRANGWEKDSNGWTKNGAFYGAWEGGASVGQFEGNGGVLATQIDLPPDLPPKVTLHLINAMADARDVLDEEAALAEADAASKKPVQTIGGHSAECPILQTGTCDCRPHPSNDSSGKYTPEQIERARRNNDARWRSVNPTSPVPNEALEAATKALYRTNQVLHIGAERIAEGLARAALEAALPIILSDKDDRTRLERIESPWGNR